MFVPDPLLNKWLARPLWFVVKSSVKKVVRREIVGESKGYRSGRAGRIGYV